MVISNIKNTNSRDHAEVPISKILQNRSSFIPSILVQRWSLASDANGHLKSSPEDDTSANKLHLLTEKRVMQLKAVLFLHQIQR